MKENIFKAVSAVIIGGFSAYTGVLAVPLFVLGFVMVIDYITGIIKAGINAELSSRVGAMGIVKKVCYLFIVAVAAVADYLIYSVCAQLGIHLDISMYAGLIVTVWLIINELISILENLAVIGVPLPGFLTAVVKKLKIAIENAADKKEEE